MDLFWNIVFYVCLVIAIVIFLSLNVRIPLKKRIWISVLTPLVLLAVFFFLSAIFALVLIVLVFIALIYLLVRTGTYLGLKRHK